MSSRVKDIVLSLVLCLNASLFSFCPWRIFTLSHVTSVSMVLWHIKHPRRTSTVNQTASIGQTLVSHDRAHIRRLTPSGSHLFDILFLQRGPDVLMAQRRDAREGLRTHVITKKEIFAKGGRRSIMMRVCYWKEWGDAECDWGDIWTWLRVSWVDDIWKMQGWRFGYWREIRSKVSDVTLCLPSWWRETNRYMK